MSKTKFFNVIVKLEEEIVHQEIVRSKERRTAISNVLVNRYKGDLTSVSATEVNAELKYVIHEDTDTDDKPTI